ncbi:MAG: 4Fe-4S binding protein [Syntrophales bacterium]|nr:4Fe-4S binding protein [Syntrophales bacterium]
MKQKRKIITIDEEKCNGCGLCVSACAEGALQIIDGKARLISETYCDGLGACLGECPQDAIIITEREAEDFDEKAVGENMQRQAQMTTCQCPGAATREIKPAIAPQRADTGGSSHLANWPIQLMLIPTSAPYLAHSDLLIAADCVPCAYGDFHRRFVNGRVLIIACPKLDDAAYYVDKLSELFMKNDIRSLVVPFMEVPCCGGLVRIVQAAKEKAGKEIPTTYVKIGIDGRILDEIKM